jgi:hypothetical protein
LATALRSVWDVDPSGYRSAMPPPDASPPLRAIALNCTLKRGPSPSSTAVLLEEVLAELRVLASDILVVGTPIWLGQPSSVAKRVLERMDAFLGERDDAGRMVSAGRVAVAAVVGNEDGAHHVTAELYQALVDVGFSIPASGGTYWVGEAMGSVDYKDLDPKPDKIVNQNALVARHAAHLARLLRDSPYPPPPGSGG